jgi:hypothetical protein
VQGEELAHATANGLEAWRAAEGLEEAVPHRHPAEQAEAAPCRSAGAVGLEEEIGPLHLGGDLVLEVGCARRSEGLLQDSLAGLIEAHGLDLKIRRGA